jgi:hypothetical protein
LKRLSEKQSRSEERNIAVSLAPFVRGAPVEVELSDGSSHKSFILGVEDDGIMLLLFPRDGKGGLIRFAPEQILVLRRTLQNGKYSLTVRVTGIMPSNNCAFIIPRGTVVKQQLREWVRLPITKAARISYMKVDPAFRKEMVEEIVETANISVGGLGLLSRHDFKPEEKLAVKLFLDDTVTLTLKAEVRRCHLHTLQPENAKPEEKKHDGKQLDNKHHDHKHHDGKHHSGKHPTTMEERREEERKNLYYVAVKFLEPSQTETGALLRFVRTEELRLAREAKEKADWIDKLNQP